MSEFLYINYPSWIHPEVFPGIPVLGLIRWYGLMYIVAFCTAYYILKKQLKEGAFDSVEKKATEDDIFSFIAFGIAFLLIGARVFSTLVYDTSGLYREKPWLIFWPFQEGCKFTGLQGMSYHGGFIGGFLGTVIWCKIHKRSMWQWIDAMAIAIPAGYTFGRIGNFLNGELYGRITDAPWGVVFPDANKFSGSIQWVKDFALKIGMDVSDTSVLNLPRHPSQLYESFFEGIVLFAILWFLRKKKPFEGFMTCAYIFGYGFVRFIIEYFREPDADIGYRFGDKSASLSLNTSLTNISTGQVLCFGMMLFAIGLGLVLFIINRKKNQKNTASV